MYTRRIASPPTSLAPLRLCPCIQRCAGRYIGNTGTAAIKAKRFIHIYTYVYDLLSRLFDITKQLTTTVTEGHLRRLVSLSPFHFPKISIAKVLEPGRG